MHRECQQDDPQNRGLPSFGIARFAVDHRRTPQILRLARSGIVPIGHSALEQSVTPVSDHLVMRAVSPGPSDLGGIMTSSPRREASNEHERCGRRDLRRRHCRCGRCLPSRRASRRDRYRAGRRTAPADVDERQVRRVLPQLVAGSRGRHGLTHEPQHRPPRGPGARERKRVPHESARLSLRDGRSEPCADVHRARARSGSARRWAGADPLTRRKRVSTRAGRRVRSQPTGTDVLTAPSLIRRHFPYLSHETVALLHARRCGWFSGQQLGMYLLERAREKGVRLHEGRVERVDTSGGRCGR